MRGAMRRLLDAGERGHEFGLANDLPDPKHQAVVTQLGQVITRANGRLAEQRDGPLSTRAAQKERRSLRRVIRDRFFPLLVTVAQRAARDLPEVFGTFRVPLTKLSHRAFAVQVNAMLATAKAHAAELEARGLGGTVIADLEKAVTELDRLSRAIVEGSRTQIEATSDLKTIAGELGDLIELLDGNYRYYLAEDPARLRAWEMVRTVATPSRRKPVPPAGGTGASQTV
jgi:hypothetical protein